jgi:hypothetical protein
MWSKTLEFVGEWLFKGLIIWMLCGAIIPVMTREEHIIGDTVVVCSAEWYIFSFDVACREDLKKTLAHRASLQ